MSEMIRVSEQAEARGYFGPQLYCNICDNPISNYRLALGIYSTEGTWTGVRFAHKGPCARAFGPSVSWEELNIILVQLLYNSDMDKLAYLAANERIERAQFV